MAQTERAQILQTLEQAMDKLKATGADYASVSYISSREKTVTVRDGRPHQIITASPAGLSLAVRFNDRSADRQIGMGNIGDLDQVIDGLVAASALKAPYEYDRPADPEQLSRVRNDRILDCYDSREPTMESLIERATVAEAAALGVPGIVSSDGANAAWERRVAFSLSSRGDLFTSKKSVHSVWLAALADDGEARQTGHESTVAHHAADLTPAEDVGLRAAEKAVRAVGATRPDTGILPVVFSPEAASGLLGHFIGAAQGETIRKGGSFLQGRLDTPVFSKDITIINNPHIRRGMGSTLYTGAGLPTRPVTIVEGGVLKNLFLSLETSRRMRDIVGDMPVQGASNVTIVPGAQTPDELVADIQKGIYVTDLSGQGIRIVSGDYSRAATGFLIENGKIDYSRPVDEFVISSTLQNMFATMVQANDVNPLRRSVTSPTVRVEGMNIT